MFNRYEEFPQQHRTITPSDAANLARPMVIYCGSDGAISITDAAGVTVVYTLTAGQIAPVLAVKVNATGTTSTQVIGLA